VVRTELSVIDITEPTLAYCRVDKEEPIVSEQNDDSNNPARPYVLVLVVEANFIESTIENYAVTNFGF
jgi:hypothetical protein